MPSSTRQSTDSLLDRARRGSRSALNRLMAWSRPGLRRKTKGRHPHVLARKEDGSDLVQECQLVAAARFDEFKGRSRAEFRDWLASILDHLILHKQRYWGRKKRDWTREEPLAMTGGGPDVPAGSTTSILGGLVRDEDWAPLMVAAGWCREEDRDVISLHLFEDRSHEEIAAELGVSAAVVRQRYSRAVRRLGEAMRLQELMTRRGIPLRQQDVIGIRQFQHVDAKTIADRLMLPERLVKLWLADARPLIREFEKDKP